MESLAFDLDLVTWDRYFKRGRVLSVSEYLLKRGADKLRLNAFDAGRSAIVPLRHPHITRP